ncbi:MAG TPA: hypothetical protein VM580_31460, partial [Labilithrix sp.]|nr:hypothetical protein [Labilithrix sp.]
MSKMRALVFSLCLTAAALLAACGRRANTADADAASSTPTSDAALTSAKESTAVVADTDGDAGSTVSAISSVDPYGQPRTATRASCGALGGKQVSERDLKTSFVDGDDLLAIVNRSPTGQLPPDYAPTDLVDIRNGKPLSASECEKFQCLRRDAASALNEL